MYIDKNSLYFHVGGGIVADSNPESEYEETCYKAEGMLSTIHAFQTEHHYHE